MLSSHATGPDVSDRGDPLEHVGLESADTPDRGERSVEPHLERVDGARATVLAVEKAAVACGREIDRSTGGGRRNLVPADERGHTIGVDSEGAERRAPCVGNEVRAARRSDPTP